MFSYPDTLGKQLYNVRETLKTTGSEEQARQAQEARQAILRLSTGQSNQNR
jgi:hypothetical protein